MDGVFGKTQVFFRGVVGYAFNPFTTTQTEGLNWKKDSLLGQPSSPSSYQAPRDASVFVGFRF